MSWIRRSWDQGGSPDEVAFENVLTEFENGVWSHQSRRTERGVGGWVGGREMVGWQGGSWEQGWGRMSP